jgi:hypothetical protein
MAEGSETRREGWRPEAWLTRAGGVAAAILSIAGVVAFLWPDDPPKRGATLDNVSAQPNIRLSEFELRTEGGSPAMVLVAQVTDRQPVPETQPRDGTEDTPDGTSDETPDGTTDETPDGTTDETPDGTPGGSGEVEVVDEIEEYGDVDVARTTGGPDPKIELEGKAQQTTMQSLISSPGVGAARIANQAVSADKVLEIFEQTRTAPAEGGSEPVGVTVDFDVGAVGYKGDRLDVRWSMFSASTKRRVPRPWLRNRRALLLEPEAEDDKGSGSFWVPLPRGDGRWFVRVSLYDKRGQRITYADTERFG